MRPGLKLALAWYGVVGILLAALVWGCTIDAPPVVSGRIYDGTLRPPSMNTEQIAVVSLWLDAHRSGWLPQTLPMATPTKSFALKHPEGQESYLWIDCSAREVTLRQRGPDEMLRQVYQRFSVEEFEQIGVVVHC